VGNCCVTAFRHGALNWQGAPTFTASLAVDPVCSCHLCFLLSGSCIELARRAHFPRVLNCRSCLLVPSFSLFLSVDSKFCLFLFSKREPTPFFVFFWLVWYPQVSIPNAADTHTGGDVVLGKPEGSPARRHSRNSCHMFVHIVACAFFTFLVWYPHN